MMEKQSLRGRFQDEEARFFGLEKKKRPKKQGVLTHLVYQM